MSNPIDDDSRRLLMGGLKIALSLMAPTSAGEEATVSAFSGLDRVKKLQERLTKRADRRKKAELKERQTKRTADGSKKARPLARARNQRVKLPATPSSPEDLETAKAELQGILARRPRDPK